MVYQNILVLYNPASGNFFGNTVQRLKKSFLRYSLDPEILETNVSGNYSHIDFSQYDLIVVCGGDGTVNSVATHILYQNSKTPIAVIPMGSANLLASYLRIPSSIKKAVDIALSYPAVLLDVGMVNKKKYFLVAFGVGYDAIVMNLTKKILKRMFGFWAYGIGLLQGLFHFKAANFSLRLDGQSLQCHAKTLFIMNIGKFFKIDFGPNVSGVDGKGDLAIVRPVGFFDISRLFFGLLSKKYFLSGRLQYFQFRRLGITYDKNIPAQIDGEFWQVGKSIEIEILPSAISLISVEKI